MMGRNTPRLQRSGYPVAGEDRLDDAARAANRADTVQDIRDHPLDDDYYRQRTPELSKITVPVLAAAGSGLQGGHQPCSKGG